MLGLMCPEIELARHAVAAGSWQPRAGTAASQKGRGAWGRKRTSGLDEQWACKSKSMGRGVAQLAMFDRWYANFGYAGNVGAGGGEERSAGNAAREGSNVGLARAAELCRVTAVEASTRILCRCHPKSSEDTNIAAT
eukprot:6172460-Pleurochrysis_carterae.AAC.2